MTEYRLVIDGERTNTVHSYLDLTLYNEEDEVVESVENLVRPLGRAERQPFEMFADWIQEVTGDEEFTYVIDEDEGRELAVYVEEGLTPEEYLEKV